MSRFWEKIIHQYTYYINLKKIKISIKLKKSFVVGIVKKKINND